MRFVGAAFVASLIHCLRPVFATVCQEHSLRPVFATVCQEPRISGGSALLQVNRDMSTHHFLVREDEDVHVVYACTPNEFPGLLSSMLSVGRHLSDPERVVIHVFAQEKDHAALQGIATCFRELSGKERPSVQLHVTPVPATVKAFIEQSAGRSFDGRHDVMLPETFVRLFLHEYLPHARRAIWLDSDTIVKSDIMLLHGMDMQHGIAAAEHERYGLKGYLEDMAPQLVSLLGSSVDTSKAFNSGVMVLDLPRLRSSNLTQHVDTWLPKLAGHNSDADQLVLNLAVMGIFDVLDPRWNLMTLGFTDEELKATNAKLVPQEVVDGAYILHWSGTQKPWLHKPKSHYGAEYEEYDRKQQCAVLG